MQPTILWLYGWLTVSNMASFGKGEGKPGHMMKYHEISWLAKSCLANDFAHT